MLDILGIYVYNWVMLKENEILDINLYPRNILGRISEDIERREAVVIEGARRVGKTSLLFLVGQYILSEKMGKVYYFDPLLKV